MFFKRKESKRVAAVDSQGKEPVIRASICTGEKVAGFRDMQTGAFEDVMLIQDERDLETFRRTYALGEKEIRIIY